MSNLKKKEPLDAIICVKTTSSMKGNLEKLSMKDKRDFSDFIRIKFEEIIEKGGKENNGKK